MRKSNIYTQTGDNGTTSLVNGQRVRKNHTRIEAYGTIDELNSMLALLATHPQVNPQQVKTITFAQNKLFNIGAYLATDNSQTPDKPCQGLTQADIQQLEQAIDQLDSQLPPLTRFVIPGGTKPSAIAHVCRTVCRRAERRIISLQDTASVDPNVVKFINRLSDYLFVLARAINFDSQVEELFWDKDC